MLQELSILSVSLRFCLAALLGGILGFERTRKMRAAGLRTYMLVCMGAAMAMMTGQYVWEWTLTGDPGRIGAQVISGIGFIGAGAIMVTGYHRIKGLTTAAGLWLSACLGLAVGCGFYYGAVIMLGIALLAIVIGERFQEHYLAHSNRMRLYVLFGSAESLKYFLLNLKEGDITISDFDHIGNIGDMVSASFMVHLTPQYTHRQALEALGRMEGVTFIEEVL